MYLRRVFLTIKFRNGVQAGEVAESRAWAVELQRQAAAYRAEQTAKRTKSAAAVADLKVLLCHSAVSVLKLTVAVRNALETTAIISIQYLLV